MEAQAKEKCRVYRTIVADDEPEFCGWFRSLLEGSEDFQIVGEAANGTEALRLAARWMPDLLVADIYMPEPDGLELARYVRQHLPSIKVILISSHEGYIYERLAREEGALTFIPKAGLSLYAMRQVLQGKR